jgi:hypothetical protein
LLISFEILFAAPLSVIRNARPVETLVDGRRNKSGKAFHGFLGCLNKHIDHFLLITRLDGKNVEQGNGRVFLRNCRQDFPPFNSDSAELTAAPELVTIVPVMVMVAIAVMVAVTIAIPIVPVFKTTAITFPITIKK